QNHRDHEICEATESTATAAAQRDVEVVAQKARQRHVPASPELDDAGGFIGRIEVLRKPDPETPCRADCYVGVAGKIEVELHRVSESATPGAEQIQPASGFSGIERAGNERRYAIRQK